MKRQSQYLEQYRESRAQNRAAKIFLVVACAVVIPCKGFAIVFGDQLAPEDPRGLFTVSLMRLIERGREVEADFICSATLISESLVLTTKHCEGATHVRFGVDSFDDSLQRPLTKFVERSSRAVVAYNPSLYGRAAVRFMLEHTGVGDHDLAIYKFVGGTPEGFEPAKLADRMPGKDQSALEAAGFGDSDPKKLRNSYGSLHAAEMKMLLPSRLHAKIRSRLKEEPEVPNTCHGDSGGPLIARDNKNPLNSLVVGISSSSVENCLYGQSSFESIPFHYRWIMHQVKKLEAKVDTP